MAFGIQRIDERREILHVVGIVEDVSPDRFSATEVLPLSGHDTRSTNLWLGDA